MFLLGSNIVAAGRPEVESEWTLFLFWSTWAVPRGDDGDVPWGWGGGSLGLGWGGWRWKWRENSPPQKNGWEMERRRFSGRVYQFTLPPRSNWEISWKNGCRVYPPRFLCFQIRFRYILYGDRCHHQFEMRCDTFMSASQRQGWRLHSNPITKNYSANNLAMTWRFCKFTWSFLGLGEWMKTWLLSKVDPDLCETVKSSDQDRPPTVLGDQGQVGKSRITCESCFEFWRSAELHFAAFQLQTFVGKNTQIVGGEFPTNHLFVVFFLNFQFFWLGIFSG